jgi:chromate transporter
MRDVILLSLRLGLTAFGGPAAHIAMLREEVVSRRKWISDQHFLDLLSATNLIPGPNSTEMFIHIGYLRGGWPGLLAAGVAFITPAMLMVLGLAWLYVNYGGLPQAAWLLYGVKPVVIVLIAHALWMLGRGLAKKLRWILLGLLVFALNLAGVNELVLLFGAASAVMLVANAGRLRSTAAGLAWLPLGALVAPAAAPFTLGGLFWVFLKIGAVLYGSGYILFAFLHSELVQRLAWLTDQQLVDAIAVGQLTPGPVFTAATFIGYVLGGLPGSLLATVAIFLPAFLFVGLTGSWLPKLRQSPWSSAFLDGVNVASLGLMAAITWQLGQTAFVDWPSVFIAAATAWLLFRYRLNSAWLILGGALAGLTLYLIS